MTPERWRKIEEIFQTVIERAPDERKSLLTQYCGGDDELRREVESLLDHEVPGTFIQEPIRDAAQSLTGEASDELIGRRLGAYRVARLIGRGGMGAVYEAARADEQFEQQVAIKIIKRGMDTDFVRDRFTRERRILARLEHPHIARLIDGGETGDGRPYFVMEFVEGRAICDTETEKPSAAVSRSTNAPAKLRKQLAGDLDNIVLMAMRKEPERRYQSVEQFSEDIRRHLDGLPVIARQDTIGYRAEKFIRRHKLSVAATAMVILSLLIGVAMASYQARRAERRFQQVRKLANTFLFDFHDKIRNLPGSTEAREMVVRTALEYLDSLAQEAAGDAALETELAIAYQKVGDAQGDPWTPNLGHTVAAMASYRKSLNLAEGLVARGHTDLKTRRMLAEDYFKLGALLSESGDKMAAQATLRQGLSVAEAIERQTSKEATKEATKEAGEEDDFRLLMNFHVRIGNTRLDTGDAAGGLESYRQAQQLAERRVAASPKPSAQASLAVANNHVGEGLLVKGDLIGSIEQFRRSQTIDEELVKRQPDNSAYRRHLQITYGWLGSLMGNPRYINLGDRAAARRYYEAALAIAQELADADPKNARAQLDLAICYGSLGGLLADSDPARSIENYRNGLAVLRELLAISPDEFSYLRRQAGQLRGVAEARRRTGDRQGALEALRQSQAIWQTLITRDPANLDGVAGQHATLLSLAELTQESGGAAMEYSRQALALAEQEASARSTNLYARWRLADSYSSLGKLYEATASSPKTSPELRRAHFSEACAWRRKALEVWDSWNQYGVSSNFNTARREQAARALAHCDTALTKLSANSHR
jgi:hypothetical protein